MAVAPAVRGPGGVRLRAGTLRGRVVPVPDGVRPTEGRVREAFFDIVGPRVAGCRFLDLFAGCGAVGIEASSRGAAAVVQVDGSPAVVRRLQSTHGDLGLERIEVRCLDLPRRLKALAECAGDGFDWIFADPPYAFDAYEELLDGLPALLAADGVVVVEHEVRRRLGEGRGAAAGVLSCVDERRYGDCALSFYASPPAHDSSGSATR